MELKPCPFCGGKATLHDESDCGDGWMVYCPSNECSIAAETMRYESEAEAIEAWNTRVERTCKPKRVPVSFDRELWPGVTEMHRLVCSECGCADLGMRGVNYCPNCGAKVVEA